MCPTFKGLLDYTFLGFEKIRYPQAPTAKALKSSAKRPFPCAIIVTASVANRLPIVIKSATRCSFDNSWNLSLKLATSSNEPVKAAKPKKICKTINSISIFYPPFLFLNIQNPFSKLNRSALCKTKKIAVSKTTIFLITSVLKHQY